MKKWSKGKSFVVLWIIAIAVPALVALATEGFSSKALPVFQSILQNMQRILLVVFTITFARSFFSIHKTEREMEESRRRCIEVHRQLFQYIEEHSLNGFDQECQILQEKLRKELQRHFWKYPSEFWHDEVRHLWHYCREVETLEKYW